jgi:hypothetical protein
VVVFTQVIGNFFERMGSNVSTDRSPEESERGPSPADTGGPIMKKRPLGDDSRPATVPEKKKPPGYRDDARNKLATSELVNLRLYTCKIFAFFSLSEREIGYRIESD